MGTQCDSASKIVGSIRVQWRISSHVYFVIKGNISTSNHACTYICVYVCVCVCVCVCVFVCMYECMYECMFVRMYGMCMYVCLSVAVGVFVCMYGMCMYQSVCLYMCVRSISKSKVIAESSAHKVFWPR